MVQIFFPSSVVLFATEHLFFFFACQITVVASIAKLDWLSDSHPDLLQPALPCIVLKKCSHMYRKQQSYFTQGGTSLSVPSSRNSFLKKKSHGSLFSPMTNSMTCLSFMTVILFFSYILSMQKILIHRYKSQERTL